MVCCFTGHRPEKLKISEEKILQILQQEIKLAIEQGAEIFITGMAPGFDIQAAELVLQFKERFPNIRLVCAVPYAGFERSWNREWRERYHAVLKVADQVEYIAAHYIGKSVFQIRNQWMVDHSDLVIAAYRGTPGGTRNTIAYAIRKGVSVRMLDLPQEDTPDEF